MCLLTSVTLSALTYTLTCHLRRMLSLIRIQVRYYQNGLRSPCIKTTQKCEGFFVCFFTRLWRSCAANLKHNLHLDSTLDFSARNWKTSVLFARLTITPVFGCLVMSSLTEFQSHSAPPRPCAFYHLQVILWQADIFFHLLFQAQVAVNLLYVKRLRNMTQIHMSIWYTTRRVKQPLTVNVMQTLR